MLWSHNPIESLFRVSFFSHGSHSGVLVLKGSPYPLSYVFPLTVSHYVFLQGLDSKYFGPTSSFLDLRWLSNLNYSCFFSGDLNRQFILNQYRSSSVKVRYTFLRLFVDPPLILLCRYCSMRDIRSTFLSRFSTNIYFTQVYSIIYTFETIFTCPVNNKTIRIVLLWENR